MIDHDLMVGIQIRESEDYIKTNWTETRNELVHSMEQQEVMRGFLSLFGNDGPVVCTLLVNDDC